MQPHVGSGTSFGEEDVWGEDADPAAFEDPFGQGHGEAMGGEQAPDEEAPAAEQADAEMEVVDWTTRADGHYHSHPWVIVPAGARRPKRPTRGLRRRILQANKDIQWRKRKR